MPHSPDGSVPASGNVSGGFALRTGSRHTLVVHTSPPEIVGPAERTLWIVHVPTQGFAPVMPELPGFHLRLPNANDASRLRCMWRATLTYVTRARADRSFSTEVVWEGTSSGAALPPDFLRRTPGNIVRGRSSGGATTTAVAGGDLRVTASVELNGQTVVATLSGYRILGRDNPPSDAVVRRLATLVSARDASWLVRISCKESGRRQFHPAGTRSEPRRHRFEGEPVMNYTGDGGAGLMQITNPRPGPAELWDWRINVDRAQAVYAEKARVVTGYVRRVRAKVREMYGDRVVVPDLTADQFIEDVVRGFNGFPGRDNLGLLGSHEFRICISGSPPIAVWERVPVADRPRAGDPNYVALVRDVRCP